MHCLLVYPAIVHPLPGIIKQQSKRHRTSTVWIRVHLRTGRIPRRGEENGSCPVDALQNKEKEREMEWVVYDCFAAVKLG